MTNDNGAKAFHDSADLLSPAEGPSPLSRHFTHWLDEVFRVPGTKIRFGLDPLLGFIPWAESIVATALGGTVLLDAVRLRAPLPVLVRMCSNYAINWALGTVPVIGPLFDALWRSNVKNLALLRRTIENREQVRKATIAYWVTALVLVLGTTLTLALLPVAAIIWGVSVWLG